jgi:hypothetical protein
MIGKANRVSNIRSSFFLLRTWREGYKVKNDINKKLSKEYCSRFGEIAVDMGFVTAKQFKQAFAEQAADNLSKNIHRLIWSFYFKNGWMNNWQIDIIPNELFKKKGIITFEQIFTLSHFYG